MGLRVGIAGLVVLAGCSGSSSDGPVSGNDAGDASSRETEALADTATDDTAPLPPSSCPFRLTPIEPSGTVQSVGSGTADSCTEKALRDALTAAKAAGGGTVTFSCGGKTTIVVSSALAVGSAKDKTVVLDGKGEITLDGGGKTRILDLDNYTNLVVQRITLANGFVAAGEPATPNKPSDSGAAIRHPWFGTLKAIDVRFENNKCAGREGEIGGGAVFAGGLTEAIFSGCQFVGNSASNGGGLLNRSSTLTIVDSQFVGNGALSVGDGQFGNGGGVYVDGMNDKVVGSLNICGTRFEKNTAMTHGSGVFAYFYPGSASSIRDCSFDGNIFGTAGQGSGALYHEAAPLTLTGTTFSNHTTGQDAGALFLGAKSTADVTNCTFANNKVTRNGAGIFNGGSTLHLTHCTFSGNDADYGPAIFKGASATVTVKSTLFAKNTTANKYSATSCHEAMTDLGGNLQWPATKASGSADQPCVAGIKFADPLLGPLADNGGLTKTFALGAGSPAIGLTTGCPATDQRGKPRSSPCDTGAFEVQP